MVLRHVIALLGGPAAGAARRVVMTSGIAALCLVSCRCSGDPAVAAAPVVNGPALALVHEDASDNPGESIFLSVNGTGFGGPRRGPLGACGAAGSGSYLEVTRGSESLRLASTDPGIVSWKDVRIVAALPRETLGSRVRVCSRTGASEEASIDAYAYVHLAVPPPGPPLALAIDPAGRVWINSEFDHTLQFFDPSTQQVAVVDIPHGGGPGAFSNHLFGPDAQTWFSASNEDILVDPQGRIWLGQAGFSPIPGPAESYPDHSRIVSYDPANGNFRIYNVPGDRNGITGLAWDDRRRRIWFTEVARNSGGFFPVVAQRARIASFDPERIAPDNLSDFASSATCTPGPQGGPGTCSNVSTRACLRDSDCALVEQLCPPRAADDSGCWREYELPADFPCFQPAHLVVHPDGTIWFTVYWVGNAIGRLDPSTETFARFPLAAPVAKSACRYEGCSCFCAEGDAGCARCDSYCCQLQGLDSAPWFLGVEASGDLVFTEYYNNAVGRLLVASAGDPACRTLGSDGRNPCIREWIVPGVDQPRQTVHSLALHPAGDCGSRRRARWATRSSPLRWGTCRRTGVPCGSSRRSRSTPSRATRRGRTASLLGSS